jgi:two-component system, OmpR family, response regulator
MSGPDLPITVLLVEDDMHLGRLTSQYLEGCGLKVQWVTSGVRALAESRALDFDVVLLDLLLPGRDGIDVCRELRTVTAVPVIMVTARREEADRVLGFDAGADDYVTKPFSSRELVSRIRAVVRRSRGDVGPSTGVIRAGAIVLDPLRLDATIGGRPLQLTNYEFALLRALAERVGRVLSREQLMELARGNADDAFDRSIDVQVSKLRQKLGDDARSPRFLKTIRGAGYMLVASELPGDGVDGGGA